MLTIAVTDFKYDMWFSVINSSGHQLWFSDVVIMKIKLAKATVLVRSTSVIISWEHAVMIRLWLAESPCTVFLKLCRNLKMKPNAQLLSISNKIMNSDFL